MFRLLSSRSKLDGYSQPIAVSPMPGDKVEIGRREGIELLKFIETDRQA
jgi:hypothetical protein